MQKYVPWLLLVTGIGVMAYTWFKPYDIRPVYVPAEVLSLHPQEVTFTVPESLDYTIGLEMDLSIAKSLFPCSVDSEVYTSRECEADLPASASISLFKGNARIYDAVLPAPKGRGGRYISNKAFIHDFATLPLVTGQPYRLYITYLNETRTIAPTHPRLIVEMDSRYLEQRALYSLLFIGIGGLLSLIGGVWLVIASIFKRRYRTRST